MMEAGERWRSTQGLSVQTSRLANPTANAWHSPDTSKTGMANMTSRTMMMIWQAV